MIIPSLKNIDNILKFYDYFNNPQNQFFQIDTEQSFVDPYNYSFQTIEFLTALYENHFMQPFDWSAFNTLEYVENLENADICTITKILTAYVRADRFCSGSVAHLIKEGHLRGILNRLMEIKLEIEDRFYGALLGLAVGDALGAPVEFKPPGSFEPVTDFASGGPHNLKTGEWTDDTSLALCSAESLINCQGFDAQHQMQNFLKWYQEGYLSVNGTCFDIGNTTREALEDYEKTGNPYSGPSHEMSAGNGSLMRIAPIALFYFSDTQEALEFARLSSSTTHQHPLAIQSCQYLTGLISGALQGVSKEKLLSSDYSPLKNYWEENPMQEELREVFEGSFKTKNPPEIRGRGYVVKSLEAALWAFYNSTNFKEGALLAVNLGEDADTTGAIYGQLAGAYYARSGIPDKWINNLAQKEMIEKLVEGLILNSK
jgi:ADP-ribosylglycohydrolase